MYPEPKQPPLDRIPSTIVSLHDYERLAPKFLEHPARAFLFGGAADESTIAENARSWHHRKLLPRVLTNLAEGHTSTTLFGHLFPSPIFVAPIACQRLFHENGELATALGAAAAGVGMIVSQQASTTLEDIAATADSPRWLQLYLHPDRKITRDLLARAEAASFQAIVVTVDAPVHGMRHREQLASFHIPPEFSSVNCPPLPSDGRVFGALATHAPTWENIAWVKATTRLPVILKGILHPADALLARDHGADGIVVSNHGGRTLDTAVATANALPGIADALDGSLPILVDGGIRRGTDILKAIALGASAVLIGRPAMHGLAVAGAVGVAHVLRILQYELEIALALTGHRSLDTVNRAILWQPQPH